MRKITIFSIITVMLMLGAASCKKSGGAVITAPVGTTASVQQTVTGTYTISTSGSSYSVNGITTPITVPSDVQIFGNYAGSINVILDANGSGTATGTFSGTGTITFTIPSGVNNGTITVTLTGDPSLNPAFSATYTIALGGSSYTANGQTSAINTGSAVIATSYAGSVNVNLDSSGNGTATGIFNGVGTITFTIPSGKNNGTVTVTLTGNGTLPIIQGTYTIASTGSSYTVNGQTTAINTAGATIASQVTSQLNVQLDANGNGTATGTFSGVGTITFTIPSGVNGGTITVTLTGNGDVVASGNNSGSTGDTVVDAITLQGFENIVYKIKETGAILSPGTSYYVQTAQYGVITIEGKVKAYQQGDGIFVRVKKTTSGDPIESQVSVNADGTFSVDVVVYDGENYVTLVQKRGTQYITRSDVIKVKSSIGKPVYQFQLSWDGYGDVDLHAYVGSTHVYYGNLSLNTTTTKAELDVDNTWQFGPENIRIFKAPAGTQVKVYVHYFWNKAYNYNTGTSGSTNNGTQTWTLKIFNSYGELIETKTGTFTAAQWSKTGTPAGSELVATYTVN